MTWYDLMGAAIAQGHGLRTPSGQPTAAWPPGYPALLGGVYALFGSEVRAAQWAQAALGALTCLVAFGIGRHLFGRAAGLLAALFLALHPAHVMFSALLMSEVAFTLVFACACLAFCAWAFRAPEVGWSRWAATGALLGAATLFRGTTLAFPVVPAAIWLIARRSWRYALARSGALLLGFGLVLGPWVVRNAVQMDAFVLVSTSLGRTLSLAHLPEPEYRERFRAVQQSEGEVGLDRYQRREAIAWALAHPREELFRIPRELARLYASDHVAMSWGRIPDPDGRGRQPILPGVADAAVAGVADGYHLALLALALFALPAALRRDAPARWLLPGAILYVTLLHSVVFNGNPRFHLPLAPLVCVLAASTVLRARDLWRRRQRGAPSA
jgi:4-amino-4-deoxy-L-arabinose transferase-like glycosyltransferase